MALNPKFFNIAVLPDVVLNTMVEQAKGELANSDNGKVDKVYKELSEDLMDLMVEQAYRELLIQRGMN